MNISLFHPELQKAAKTVPSMKLTYRNLWLWRFLVSLRLKPLPKDIVIENRYIPGGDSKQKIRLRIYKSKSSTGLIPGLLWFHGGGLVMGKPEVDDPLCIRFVQEAGIFVVSVQYRYAPQHPFPAGLKDAYTSLKWLHLQGRQLGIDVNRLGVGGESAGGCIAASLAQMAKDRNEIPLKTQHLIYPMLDDRSSIRSDLPDDTRFWTKQSNRFGWEAYLSKPCGSREIPQYAVPGRRNDLSGLPPAWIGVGSMDLFHDENVAYAQRLRAHGVDCDIHVVDGAFHCFDAIAPNTQVTQEFISAQIDSLKKNLFAGKRVFTAFDMIPGQIYHITKAFSDFDKYVHDIGESWIFVNKSFLPYDDGLTIFIEQNGSRRSFRMQARPEEQDEIVSNFSNYVEEEIPYSKNPFAV